MRRLILISALVFPTLQSLMSVAGVEELPAVKTASPPSARLEYVCQASPRGYGLSGFKFVAVTQACTACRLSSQDCRYECFERVGGEQFPFPVSRGHCD